MSVSFYDPRDGNGDHGFWWGFGFLIFILVFMGLVIALGGCAPAREWTKASDMYLGLKSRRLGKPYVIITGEVKHPGLVSWNAGIGAYTALGLAGGLTPQGEPCCVRLIRGDQALRVDARRILGPDGELEDVPLLPGDILHVDERWNVKLGRTFGSFLGGASSLGSFAMSFGAAEAAK